MDTCLPSEQHTTILIFLIIHKLKTALTSNTGWYKTLGKSWVAQSTT